jgi:ascorbate-specific PTS system EIIC-type component UlaA
MTHHDGDTRIYINWRRLRPVTLRGWLTVLASIVLAVCVIVLVAAIASTLLVVALVAGAWWSVQRLFRGRDRAPVPYRNDDDA